ncbi:unnamed protein product [Dibothriocephalus latus]|uniref:Uncharacterized protein n=1 Tax=Dibothriocephalus latus TaxID=60516 RepID=A0A3P7NB44_DIBLA|nr:unnamed protein product [Dibothriocephalus latus]
MSELQHLPRALFAYFAVFVREHEREKFSQLCKGLTGLPVQDTQAGSEGNTVPSSGQIPALAELLSVCPRCQKRPIENPLRAPCSHCCCFTCWRDIIEKVSTCDSLGGFAESRSRCICSGRQTFC